MTTTLLLLPADAAAESIAVRADAQGQVQSVGHATAPPEPSARALLVVPGVDVHLRWLRLPGRSMAQSRAAARLQLAEHLAIETQALHVVIAGSAEADGTRLVAAVDSVVMQQWLARATQLGFAPDAVVPDCLLLEPGADATAAVMHWDGRWLIRGAQLACSLEPEAARLLLGDRVPAVPPGPDPTHSIAGFARSAAHVPIDLLQHPFANKAAAEQSALRAVWRCWLRWCCYRRCCCCWRRPCATKSVRVYCKRGPPRSWVCTTQRRCQPHCRRVGRPARRPIAWRCN